MNQIEINYLRFSRKKEKISYVEDTEYVDLSDLDIFDIDLSHIGGLHHLKGLNLSHNRLEEISLSGYSLPRIESLDISNNKIFSIEASGFRLSRNLKELRLNGNLLKEVPFGSFSDCSDLEVLDISKNHIHMVNLGFLENCSKIRELNLSNNQLENIDISPLSNSESLEIFDLSHNWIRELDTVPLHNKPKLKRFAVNENPLTSLEFDFVSTSPNLESIQADWTQLEEGDLDPLKHCQALRSLGISQNKIANLDLFPIIHCQELESLNISGINSNTIELWPLFGLPKLLELNISPRISFESFPYSSITWPIGLEVIRSRETKTTAKELHNRGFGYIRDLYLALRRKLNPLGRYHLRASFIELYDLAYLSGFDGELEEYLISIDGASSYDEVRLYLKDVLSDSLIQQVRTGGSTHFIDLDLVRSIPTLAVIASDVIEARKHELECITLQDNDGIYDTTQLWFTVYGQDVLSALKIGLETDYDGYARIQSHLKKIGINRLGQDCDSSVSFPTRLSTELKDYLRFLAIRCCSRAATT